MKIKVKPQDFIVEEIINIPIEKKGEYALYLLKKKKENTIEVLRELSKSQHIAFKNFGYGGRKDRHAITSQYITIENNSSPLNVKGKNYSLEFLGFLRRPMGPDLIEANNFEIVIRDLTDREIEAAICGISEIKESGLPNYFDSQRFGTFDESGGFLAEKILKKHFNGALKIYLTRICSDDRQKTKERKKFFITKWGKWQTCFEKAQTPFEKSSFYHLTQNPKDFIFLLRQIPREDLSLYFSSYQAYLWNELLRRFIRSKIKKELFSYDERHGDFIFYRSLDQKEYENWRALTISLPASNIKIEKIENEEINKLYQAILSENELRLPMFNITKIRQAFFKGVPRHAIIKPKYLNSEVSEDDIYKERKKLLLNFSLPRGSYATMLVKRIFAKPLENPVEPPGLKSWAPFSLQQYPSRHAVSDFLGSLPRQRRIHP